MFESNNYYEIGEYNKLQGLQNYNIWKIKIEAIFREKLWDIIESKRRIRCSKGRKVQQGKKGRIVRHAF